MRNLKAGDKSEAVCRFCKKLVNITYQDEKLSSVDILKYGIISKLMGYCDECGSLVAIPHNKEQI